MRTFFLFFFTVSFNLKSQEINFKSYFLEDSIKIGDSISFISTLKYPINIEIIQPDSSYDYKPFEFVGKKIFPSIAKGDIIYDSTIYTLRTFELDSVQSLLLNSYILSDEDSLIISSKKDSILLISQVEDLKAKTKNNTLYEKILSILNTRKLLIITCIIAATFLTLYLMFRKKINNYFRVRRLKNSIRHFSKSFNASTKKYSISNKKKSLEHSLLVWKRFMEKNSNMPYSSSTTSEICEFTTEKNIKKILFEIDKILYSNTDEKYSIDNLDKLNNKAIAVCKKIIKKINDE